MRFVFRRFPPDRRSGVRVLDLGCGGGVHTAFFAREGFRTTAVDVSDVAIARTRARLAEEGLSAELRVASAEDLSLPAASFDVVVSVGVLDSAGAEIASRAVPRAIAALAPGGAAFFLFASDRDSRIHGENPYRLHGFTRAEVDRIFEIEGASVFVDRAVVTYRGGQSEQNEWLVTVEV